MYKPGSFEPVVQVVDGQVQHIHTDHLGTPRELSNGQGQWVWKARYRTYGALALQEEAVEEQNPGACKLRFQGQYWDEESGLHYNLNRYYDPQTGQFISQDPIGLAGGLNLYQYAPNPVTWVDLWGLTSKEEHGVSRKYGPHEKGPLGDPNDPSSKASTFRSGTYTEKVSDGQVTVYRDHGGMAQANGRYWTPEPSMGPLQSQMDSAVLPEWGNTFQHKSQMTIPQGTVYYEGPAAQQVGSEGMRSKLMGGGTQIYIPKVDAGLIKPYGP
nr:RHS repeat-associated core domain-containing protein [Limnobacter humi]